MASIPLQRTIRWLEEKGWHVGITEHWNSWAHIRQDLYGLADLAALRHDSNGTWFINACEDNGAVQAHVDKYLNGYDTLKGVRIGPNPHLPVILAARNRFSIFGWGKRGERNKRKVWTLRVLEAYLDGPEPKFKEIPEIEVDTK